MRYNAGRDSGKKALRPQPSYMEALSEVGKLKGASFWKHSPQAQATSPEARGQDSQDEKMSDTGEMKKSLDMEKVEHARGLLTLPGKRNTNANAYTYKYNYYPILL